MRADDLTLERWDRLSADEKERTARALSLPTSLTLKGIERCATLDGERLVAVFARGDAQFVLLPGGEVVLGHDHGVPLELTDEQHASWDDTASEYELELEAFLGQVLRPLHTVVLPPALVERRSTLLGYTPIEEAHEDACSNRMEFSSGGITAVHGGRAYKVEWLTHAQAAEVVASSGFVLPNEDLWEHACRAGTRTLFRWGDTCPADCYPIDRCDFDLHRRPNGFGLAIASNPYEWELCDEPGVLRGGDGGSMICGGAGFFVGWLPLASAYCDPAGAEWREQPIPDTRVRRVLLLDL